MPLIKHTPEQTATATPNVTPLLNQATDVAAKETTFQDVEKRVFERMSSGQLTGSIGRKSTSSKDEYWANREERDIEKDKHIRLSGVLQALLGSVNFGQYCTGTTAEDYLAKVEQSALRLAKFVTENAK